MMIYFVYWFMNGWIYSKNLNHCQSIEPLGIKGMLFEQIEKVENCQIAINFLVLLHCLWISFENAIGVHPKSKQYHNNNIT